MKKALLWLVAVGVLVGGVLVVWELVAKPGPLRKAWWAYKRYRNPVYEAQIKLTLQRPLSDEELAAENQLLDSMDLLMPLVRDLDLVEKWQTSNETAAMVRLAEASDFRRGSGDLELLLFVRGSDRDLIGRIINPLAKSYFEEKQLRALGSGGMPPPR